MLCPSSTANRWRFQEFPSRLGRDGNCRPDSVQTEGSSRGQQGRLCASANNQTASLEDMLPAFGKRDAMSITREEITDWLTNQAEIHEWSDATWNRYLAAFSLIYTVAGPDGNKKLAMRPWGVITRR